MGFNLPAIFANIFDKKTRQPNPQADLEALYAFRTIITMISLIRSAKRIPEKRIMDVSRELKIVDALAAIVIREHGVAAVASNPDSGSGRIEVFTSVSFVLAQNPRKPKKNPVASSTDPFIINPTRPEHLKSSNKPRELLDAFLTNDWHKPDTDTFETHVWMLAKLLGGRDDPLSFLYYVIASCYKKLIIRLTHRVSINYRIALGKVPTFEFIGGYHSDPSPNELEFDHLFICNNLPEVKPFLRIEIPNLLRKVDSRDHDFYTRETCHEYHLLLCRLLTFFLDALHTLGTLREDHADLDKILKQLDWITLLGITLRTMCGGATMKKHLLNIAKYLPDGTELAKQTEVGHETLKKVEEADEDEDEDAADPEFRSQLEARDLGLPTACHDWLQLMLLHFDATQCLADHIKSTKSSDVVIQIISQPPPDRYLLPWKTLLNNATYFPDNDDSFRVADIITFLSSYIKGKSDESGSDSTDDPTKPIAHTPRMISAETLVQRLKEIGKIPKVVDTDKGREWNLKTFNEKIEPIIETVANLELTNCVSVGWEDYARTVVAELIKFQAAWTLSDEVTTMKGISKIVQMIETIRDNAMIYWALRDNSPLDTGIGFIGNFHAEAILAAFLYRRQKAGSATLGVSKWCCPVCAFLLPNLKDNGNPFIFTSQHHTITPCALPHGLPANLISLMIQKFGGELRTALSELRDRTDLLQPCGSSIGSGHLSDSGSVHSHVKFRTNKEQAKQS